MYGNAHAGADPEPDPVELSPEQRRTLRRDLAAVTDGVRDVLPANFAVGSELTDTPTGPRATVAVQPPFGPVVSANYDLEDDAVAIDEEERTDLVNGLAASAALQVKQAVADDETPVAR